MATGRQLITYDYAGLGHSGGTVAPTIKVFALNLLVFCRTYSRRSRSPVGVLGVSMGGYISQQLALDSPDIIHKLVLSDTRPSLGPGLARHMNEVQYTVFNPIPGLPTIEAFFPSFTIGDEGVA